jgi:ABC-type polysaccharide/polyol phosphate export permease
MNSDEDNNPFADPSIRQATAQAMFVIFYLSNLIFKLNYFRSNQQTLNNYNPFTNTTVAAKVCSFKLFFLGRLCVSL